MCEGNASAGNFFSNSKSPALFHMLRPQEITTMYVGSCFVQVMKLLSHYSAQMNSVTFSMIFSQLPQSFLPSTRYLPQIDNFCFMIPNWNSNCANFSKSKNEEHLGFCEVDNFKSASFMKNTLPPSFFSGK